MYTKKLHFDAKNHLLFSDLRYDQYPSGGRRKGMKKSDFSNVFTRDTTGIRRIANRRKGGDSTHRNATFLYTSLRCGINIHILNCDRSLKKFGGVWYGVPRNRGEPPRFEQRSTLDQEVSPPKQLVPPSDHERVRLKQCCGADSRNRKVCILSRSKFPRPSDINNS